MSFFILFIIEHFFRVTIHKSIKICVKKKIIQKNTTIKVLKTFNLAPWFRRHCFADQPSHWLMGIDYKKKEVRMTKYIMPTSDRKADLREIYAYYEGYQGRHPENFIVGTV